MEGVTEVRGSHLAAVNIVAVALVDDYAVGDFHDAALDTLQLVASTSNLDEQEEVDHRVTGRLALSYADGLNENLVEAGSLTEDDGLTRLTGHAAKRTCRRAGTDERCGMLRQLLHTRLIAKDAALGALTGGVDGQDCQFAAMLTEHVHTKLVDTGRLASTGNAADTDADAMAAIRQTAVDNLLCLRLMVRVDTLYQRHGLRQDGDIATEDTFHHLGSRQFVAAEATAFQVGVDDMLFADAAVDL